MEVARAPIPEMPDELKQIIEGNEVGRMAAGSDGGARTP